jgi:hypothetical protein
MTSRCSTLRRTLKQRITFTGRCRGGFYLILTTFSQVSCSQADSMVAWTSDHLLLVWHVTPPAPCLCSFGARGGLDAAACRVMSGYDSGGSAHRSLGRALVVGGLKSTLAGDFAAERSTVHMSASGCGWTVAAYTMVLA